MDVTANRHGAVHRLNVRLFDEDLLHVFAERLKLVLGEVLALLDLGDPQIQIHGGAAANRVRAIWGGGSGGLGGAVEGGGDPLLAIGASSIAAGRRAARGERGAGEGGQEARL